MAWPRDRRRGEAVLAGRDLEGRGLPVRGQNTKNNARTRKGKAVAIAGKKK